MTDTATNLLGETEARAIKVGDIFECSWGYDQTNVDFYEVLSLSASGKTAKVRRILARVERCNGPADYLMPIAGSGHPNHPEIETKRLRHTPQFAGERYEWRFAAYSFADAYLWDGAPQYQTAAGYGH